MKRFLAALLAGLLLLSLAACSGKEDEKMVKVGVLQADGIKTMSSEAHRTHEREERKISLDATVERVNYNNLSAALMDLESGKIAMFFIEESTANYIASRYDKIAVVKDNATANFSMMTMDSNKEVFDLLNNAIKEMKADGTLDALIENELKAYIASDPEVEDLPHFEGAKTIKIGVTGDMPPMDFVATNGRGAGFNIALLAEIANRTQVNIELVQIESGARPMALSSGKVDAVFWTKSFTCNVCSEDVAEKIDGTLVTESYFSDSAAFIHLKSEK